MDRRYEVGIAPCGRYVYARGFREPLTLALALRVAQDMLALGDPARYSGCLLDLRGTTSATTVIEKYDFAYKEARIIGVPQFWKSAVLKDVGDPSPDFIQTVMRNAGYTLQLFEDEAAAIAWLTQSR